MCGIYGIWHTDGRAVDLFAVRRAVAALRHRGPDDEGYLLVETRSGRTVLCGGDDTQPGLDLPHIADYAGVLGERFDLALGFRRLSILDLSPAGHQPMPTHGRDAWLIFNGEIYNYIELRSELSALGHSFTSGTDTEVILAAYRQWGPDCLARFNGMWAFAIWDARLRRLFLARDRFGVKPLYTVSRADATFAFASEIKALPAGGVVGFNPSPGAVARYLAEGVMPSHSRGETFFSGVQALPGGYSATISQEGSRAARFWSLPLQMDSGGPGDREAISDYGDLFTDAVRLRLRADVPVGTCLSGGLDSSSIVAAAGRLMQTEHAVSLERLGHHQQTFSAVYEDGGPWNERRHIEAVIKHTGAAANYTYPTATGLWESLERVVWHQDEPFQSTSIFAQWCVMSLAHERGVTVLLDGQGADELLGGYRPFAVWVGYLLSRGRVVEAVREAARAGQVAGVSLMPLLARGLAGQLPAALLKQLRATRVRSALSRSGLSAGLSDTLEGDDSPSLDGYSSLRSLNAHLAHLALESSLPTLLRYEDRNSMAFSIEARVPFLDYRLAEFVFTRAPHLRIRDGWTKWIHRRAIEPLLPGEVVWRRDKVGFETPERHWLRSLRTEIAGLLASGVGAEYMDLSYVRAETARLLGESESSDAADMARVWRWVNLALWLRVFGGGGMSVSMSVNGKGYG